VPGAALPVWPPPTALGPAGPGGGGFQSRTNAAVLPAAPPLPPPPPMPAQPAPPPITQRQSAPVWPTEPPQTSPQYGEWARQQRPQGTVYGGAPPAHDPRGPNPPYQSNASYHPEASGSLTGHILSQGREDSDGSGGSRAVFIIIGIMALLVVGGLAAAIAYLSGVFH